MLDLPRYKPGGPRFANLSERVNGDAPIDGPLAAIVPTFSAAALDSARASGSQSGKAVERARWATVFASEHSRGRERGCVALLSAEREWSADAILAELATLPTDAERAAKAAPKPGATATRQKGGLLASYRKARGLSPEASPATTKPADSPMTAAIRGLATSRTEKRSAPSC